MARPSPDRDARRDFDVLVIGGGIVGASAAYALAKGVPAGAAAEPGERARAPRRTLLVDTYEPAHDRGSSHGDGRIVRFTYAEAVYLEMARRVYPLWAAIEADAGRSLVQSTGSWECGPADSPILAELADGLGRAGIPFEELDTDESRRRFPQLAPPAGSRVLYQRDGAIVRAGLAVETLWQLAARHGAEVRASTRVESVRMDGDGARVELLSAAGRETVRAASVVLAAGAWSGPLLASLGVETPLEPCREAVAYFPEVAGSALEHGLGSMPTVIDYSGPEPFYALPSIDVPGVKVGWHHTGPRADPDTPCPADAEVLAGIRAYVGERFPGLRPEPSKVLTCLYTNTPDYHFTLDRHPEHENLVIGAGFSGHGFKFGPIVGEILASLAVGDPSPVDLAPFRLDRFSRPAPRRRGA